MLERCFFNFVHSPVDELSAQSNNHYFSVKRARFVMFYCICK